MENIYLRYRGRSCSFTNTLSLLQDLLNERLSYGFTKIWVQGCNNNKVKICFTIFNKNSYRMRFIDFKNFRKFRPDADDLDFEIGMIESTIESLRIGILNDFIG